MSRLRSIVRQIIAVTETAASNPSPADLERQFSFYGINYDNVNGIGNVPFNQSINYRGFSVMMSPEQFIQLVPSGAFDKGGFDYIKEAIRTGQPIATPFLTLDMNGSYSEVVSHEGRNRIHAIRALYSRDHPVMVQITVRGIRARNLTIDMIKSIQKRITPELRMSGIKGPHFGSKVCFQNKWIII